MPISLLIPYVRYLPYILVIVLGCWLLWTKYEFSQYKEQVALDKLNSVLLTTEEANRRTRQKQEIKKNVENKKIPITVAPVNLDKLCGEYNIRSPKKPDGNDQAVRTVPNSSTEGAGDGNRELIERMENLIGRTQLALAQCQHVLQDVNGSNEFYNK